MSSSRTERTRAALVAAALDLFEERGYDATTAADVAAAAGVTEMTFFRHFPSKAAILLDDPYDPLIADAVAATPDRWPPLVRVAEGLRTSFATLAEGLDAAALGQMRRRLRIAAATPSLRPAMLAGTATTSAAVADRLAAAGVDPVHARIVSTAVLAGVTEALLSWAADPVVHGDLATPLGTACDLLSARP